MPHPTDSSAVWAALALLTLAACRPGRPAVVGPVQDAAGSAGLLRERSGLERPLRIVFGWQLNDAGARVRGRGVARVEPPYKARLDLFLGNGETALKAALVDGELRLPPGASEDEDLLPPPDLMWGVLGIFRPATDAELVGGDRLEGDGTRLRYRYADGTELHYWVIGGRVRSVERLDGGHVVERVEVEVAEGERYPSDATYRNLAEYRELRLSRESLEPSAPYAPSIWYPMSGGEPR